MRKTIITLTAALAVAVSAQAADESVNTNQKAHYQRPNEPFGRTAFVHLPPGVVRPEGWLRDWCDLARQGVMGHPYDYPGPAQAIVYAKGWTGEDLPGAKHAGPHGRGWPAEQCATWLEGAIRLGAILDDQALVDEIKGRLLLVAENVLKAPDEAFMFMWWTTEDDYPLTPAKTKNKLDWFDVTFGNGNIGTAMAAGYEITRDPRLLKAIEKAYRPNPRWKSIPLNPVHGPNAEAALHARALGADPTVLGKVELSSDPARRWLAQDHTGNLLDFSKRTHTASYLYGRISSIARFPWVEDNAPILEIEERNLRTVEQYYMLPSRAMQGDEVARGIGAYRGNESCTNMQIRWTGALLAASGRGYYGDRTEECFFNMLPACWTRDMEAYTYFHNPNSHPGAPPRSRFVPLHGTLCCMGQMTKAMTYFVQNMWMGTWDNGLAWVAYGPCTVRAKAGHGDGVWVDLKSNTSYPFEETIELAVDPEAAATFPLLFRVPQWCEQFAVKVNGKRVIAPSDKGFVTVRREWNPGDKVTMELPMSARVHVARELPGAPFGAVSYGPLSFCLPVEKDGKIDPDARWKFALDAPEGAEMEWKLQRRAMPEKWDWPLEAPLTLSVTAIEAEWEPIVRKWHDVAEELKLRDNVVTYTHNDVTCLPPDPFPDGEPTTIRMIPYGCALYRVSMFPITERTAPRIVVPNPDPAVDAPLFVRESEVKR